MDDEHVVETERPVMVADVLAYAKKSCTRCHGAGVVTRVFHASAKGETRETSACACALRRFKKQRHGDVVTTATSVSWKPGKAPAMGAS